jgi:hypothetical protein
VSWYLYRVAESFVHIINGGGSATAEVISHRRRYTLPLLRRHMSSSGKCAVTMIKYTKTKAPKFRQTAVWSSYTMLGGAIVVCRNLGALVISIILVISHHGDGLVVMV